MKELLFVPVDVEITNTSFELEGNITFHQKYWKTSRVVKHGDDYENHRDLLNQLSLNKTTTFNHKIQMAPAGEHVDIFDYGDVTDEIQQIIENEPSGFHAVLKGNVDSLEIFDGVDWVNPILPKVPMMYLLNLTTCLHRVKEDHLRETLYIKGFIDPVKHKELLNRSLEKYGHLAVYRKSP